MSTATGDAAINPTQIKDGSNVNTDQESATAKLQHLVYGALGLKNATPLDASKAGPSDGTQKNAIPLDGSSDSHGTGDQAVQRQLPTDGPLPWRGGDLQVTRTEPGKPERLPTGDTEIHEKDRDIIVMPKDEGSLVINRDGSYDLQLNKNSKETAEITQKDGTTTITFKPSGDQIEFDKDGLLNISRGNTGVTWLRFEPIKLEQYRIPGMPWPGALGDPSPGHPGDNQQPARPPADDVQPAAPPPIDRPAPAVPGGKVPTPYLGSGDHMDGTKDKPNQK